MTPDDTLAELYQEFRPWLLGYARMLDAEHADDAVQEAFAVLGQRIGKPPPVQNPQGFLVTVLQRTIRRRFGRAAKWRQLVSLDRSAAAHFDYYSDPDLARSLAKLPHQQRACLALRFGKDLTIDQIGELLDLHPSTVKTHISRGLSALRQELDLQ